MSSSQKKSWSCLDLANAEAGVHGLFSGLSCDHEVVVVDLPAHELEADDELVRRVPPGSGDDAGWLVLERSPVWEHRVLAFGQIMRDLSHCFRKHLFRLHFDIVD